MLNDTYDRATLKAAQLEALIHAAIAGDTMETLSDDLRTAYLGACADAATEMRELLAKLAPTAAPAPETAATPARADLH